MIIYIDWRIHLPACIRIFFLTLASGVQEAIHSQDQSFVDVALQSLSYSGLVGKHSAVKEVPSATRDRPTSIDRAFAFEDSYLLILILLLILSPPMTVPFPRCGLRGRGEEKLRSVRALSSQS